MPIRNITHRLFAQCLLLLVLHVAAALVVSVKFIGDDPLALSLPYHQLSAFSHVLLNLAIITGLLGAGLHIAHSSESGDATNTPFTWGYRGWTLLLVLAFLAGVLGLLEGRHHLELPPLLDTAQAVLVAAFIVLILQSASAHQSALMIWAIGMSLSVICTLMGLIPSSDVIVNSTLGGWAVGLNTYAAYLLAVLALSFWFSQVDNSRMYVSAGLGSVSGVLLTLAGVGTLSADEFSRLLSTIGFIVVPLAYLVFGAYSYKRANGWHLLGVILLIASGLLGAIQALPGVQQWTQGTRLSDLQMSLSLWGSISIVLAVVQHVFVAQGRLNTIAFWLAAVGSVVGSAALAGAGLVQVYMERILSIGYLETQTAIIPLYLFWVIGSLLTAVGIALYTVQQLIRRV